MTNVLAPRVPRSAAAPPHSYEELLERVRETLAAGRRSARQALQEIESRMFWETGRWIHLYLQYEKRTPGRAPYGEKVISKLAEDLAHDKDYLYDSLKVYRNNTIFGTYRKLTVGLHRVLSRVKDEVRRKALRAEAQKNGWTRDELLRRIRAPQDLPGGRRPESEVRPSTVGWAPGLPGGLSRSTRPGFRPRASGPSLPAGRQAQRGPLTLRARKGKLHHYRLVERNGRLLVDLGFRDFREFEGPKGNFRDEDIVEGDSFDQLTKRHGAAKTDLYTYRAEVLRFPDADTYQLFIHKGFGGFREDRIRLRGIDAPEIDTPEGRAAKAFVEELLTLPEGERRQGGGPYRNVLITTTKTPDKWDRYLVDLYFKKDGQEIYLNRLLLEKGHAVLYLES